jgi:SAM-dependent methyltransferase
MSDSPQIIHDAVRARYGAIAEGTQASCCTPSTQMAQPIHLYDSAALEGLPIDVTGLSLGCGDPVSIASLRPGETVLDLGSGGGIDCFLAARQVGPSGRVIGLDMTPAMLERANANKAQLEAENVEFRQGQIEAMPIDSASVDVIMSNCVINLSPDKAAVFAEAFRVLKPGGRISISDIVTEGHFTAEQRADLERWAECATGALDAQDYLALILAAGFVDVQIVDKVDADGIITREPGMPRVYSARVTARKPL